LRKVLTIPKPFGLEVATNRGTFFNRPLGCVRGDDSTSLGLMTLPLSAGEVECGGDVYAGLRQLVKFLHGLVAVKHLQLDIVLF